MEIVKKIQEAQQSGMLICPRCGKWMEKPISHNAVSRVADVYVCSVCGMDEAIRDFGKIPLPIEEWVISQMWKESAE